MAKNHNILLEIGQGLSLMLGLPTVTTWETASRPTEAKRGTFGFNTKTKCLEYWDGENWFKASMQDKA